MAYSSFNTQFTRVGPENDNCPTIWTYVSTDTALTVCTSGYFNALAGKLKVGDLIYWTTASSPWLAGSAGLAVVKSNTRNLLASPPVTGVVDLFSATVLNTTINSA
ncbi:MAG TPA: hypothetical protein VGU20_31115 [Stellaceae bacterium]|nr:hypothetical protein [Terriglobia bacterium]HEV2551802.1 hypothetical protein [Stellaceae bacterium]